MGEQAHPVPEDQLALKAKVAEALKPQKGLYKVVGKREVAGKKHGEIVELDMTADQIHALMAAGHIVVAHIESNKVPKPAKPAQPEGK